MDIKPFYKQIISNFGKESLFEFHNEDHIYVLVGYPHWRAFIINSKSNLRLEVFPRINLVTKKLEFLEEPSKDSAKESLHIQVEDEATLNSYLEKEKEFFNTIPEEIINRVKIFCDSHWEIISAIILYGHYFIKLIDSNPVLAYLLVNLDKINPSFSMYIDKSYIEILITEKQKEILGLANFPPTKSMVKLFSKIDIKTVDVELLKDFRFLFITKQKREEVPFYLQMLPFLTKPDPEEEMLKVLSRAPAINKNLIKTIAYYPSVSKVLSSQALQELSVSDSFQVKIEKLRTMASVANDYNIKLHVDSLNDLERIEQKFKEAVNKRKDQINHLPSPPIPDGNGIYAIRTVAELNSWAKKQQNCIRSYAKSILAGKCFLYKVIIGAEEATLEILRTSDGLKLGQLKGFRNSKVSYEVTTQIKKWFYDSIKQKKNCEQKIY